MRPALGLQPSYGSSCFRCSPPLVTAAADPPHLRHGPAAASHSAARPSPRQPHPACLTSAAFRPRPRMTWPGSSRRRAIPAMSRAPLRQLPESSSTPLTRSWSVRISPRHLKSCDVTPLRAPTPQCLLACTAMPPCAAGQGGKRADIWHHGSLLCTLMFLCMALLRCWSYGL